MRREPGNEVDYFSRVGVTQCSPEGEEQCVTQTQTHRRCAMGRVKRGNKGLGGEKIYHCFVFSPPPLLSPSSALVTN